MKRILTILLLTVTFLAGCGYNNTEKFEDFSGKFYVQMFMDGEQSGAVNKMYEEYIASYGDYEGSELYEAINGMYHGLNDGNATKYQLSAMQLFDDLN